MNWMRRPTSEEIAHARREAVIRRLYAEALERAVALSRPPRRPVSPQARAEAQLILAMAERNLRELLRPLNPLARAILEAAKRRNRDQARSR